LDVVVAWLVPPTVSPPPTHPSFHHSFDGSSPTGTYQKRTKLPRKKDRKQNHGWFFSFFWCVMSVHVLICTAAAAQCHRSPCFPQSFHFIFLQSRKEKENTFYDFFLGFLFRNSFHSFFLFDRSQSVELS
jgi:hypothetical protein